MNLKHSPFQLITKYPWRFAFVGLVLLATLLTIVVVVVGSGLVAPAPSEVGEPTFPAESITFASESGSVIHGWFAKGSRADAAIVLFHPVRASRLAMVGRAELFLKAGYSVLLFDFQAHGESPGEHITMGYLESRDAKAAVQWLRSTCPGARIGGVGFSLGGAAALLGPEPVDVDALVLECVYPTIEQAVWNRIHQRLGPLTGLAYPLLIGQLKLRLGIGAELLHPIDGIRALKCPVYIIGGELDAHTPPDETRALYDAAATPKELWIVPNAAHADFYEKQPEEYSRRVLGFFEATLVAR